MTRHESGVQGHSISSGLRNRKSGKEASGREGR